jgi:enoyl-CoA hydratase/carnithine racemase
MAFTTITLEKQDRVGTLTLNRPEKLNAMTPALISEFADALTQVERDPRYQGSDNSWRGPRVLYRI